MDPFNESSETTITTTFFIKHRVSEVMAGLLGLHVFYTETR